MVCGRLSACRCPCNLTWPYLPPHRGLHPMRTNRVARWTCVISLAVLCLAAGVRAERGDRGHEFRLFGGARDSVDPQNSTNDVVLFDTTATAVSGAVRKINKRTQ